VPLTIDVQIIEAAQNRKKMQDLLELVSSQVELMQVRINAMESSLSMLELNDNDDFHSIVHSSNTAEENC
jgi:hypothetical protein